MVMRLFLVVRDVDEGDADLGLDPLQLDLHLLAELQVERAQRLVEQQHLRLVDERPRQRHALRLAAGELRRLARPRSRGAGPARASRPTCWRDLGFGHAAALAEAEGDVVEDGHVREQRVVLEDGVDLALVRRQPGDVLLPGRRCRRSAPRSRRSSAGWWSCRSRRGRAAPRSSPRSKDSDRSSTAFTSPNCFVTCSRRTSGCSTQSSLPAMVGVFVALERRTV